jgi:hypothetical protein
MHMPKPDSPRCRHADGSCQGVRVDAFRECWAHLSPADRKQALSQLKPGSPIDARGTHLTTELLTDILVAMRRDGGSSVLGDARFDGALFDGTARFNRVHFSGAAQFVGAQFTGDAWFRRVQFRENAEFSQVQFGGNARFDWAQFGGNAEFRRALFSGNARFNHGRFSHRASFRGARFMGDARFMDARFDGDARLEEAFLETERVLGPLVVEGRLTLDETTVDRHVVIEAFTRRFTCIGTEFRQGATIRLRWADVVLDHCIFGQPSTVSFAQLLFRERHGGLTPEGGLGRELLTEEEEADKRVGDPTPRLLSMRGVDVSNLTLVELDLRPCLFQGVHKRAELRIVGARPFEDTPDDRVRAFGIRLWRHWTNRQALAEEHRWRCRSRYPGRWYPRQCRSPTWLAQVTGQKVDELDPARLAAVYRALRKAQEDSKNQPGAADLYYGEMEMRRLARSTPLPEQFILWLYWLISGYSLRGLRTLLALLTLLTVATGLIAWVGFPRPQPVTTFTATIVGTTPRQSVQIEPQSAATVTSRESVGKRLRTAAVVALEGAVFRAPEQQLSYPGRVIQDLVRISGPVLLGLMLLSIRNRVKR